MRIYCLIFSILISMQHLSYSVAQGKIEKLIPGQIEFSDTTLANLYFERAEKLTYWAKYDSANIYFQSASTIYKHLAEKHKIKRLWEKYVACYNFLGDNYRIKCDCKTAMFHLEKALAIGLKYCGENHACVATSYFDMSCYYEYIGDYNKMLEFATRSLGIRLKLFGSEHLEVANCYESLGHFEIQKSRYDKALEYFQKALNIRLKLVGENHLHTARSYYGFYRLYYFLKDMDEAYKYVEKSQLLKLQLLNNDHPELAPNYIGYGNYYQSKGLLDKALDYTQKATDILHHSFGEFHYFLIATYTNTAHIYADMKNFEMAVQYHKKAQTLIKQLYGENPWFAYSCQYLGEVYSLNGDFDQSLLWLKKSLAIQQNQNFMAPI